MFLGAHSRGKTSREGQGGVGSPEARHLSLPSKLWKSGGWEEIRGYKGLLASLPCIAVWEFKGLKRTGGKYGGNWDS